MLDQRRATWFVFAGLAALTIAAYTPVWTFGFVSLDDPLYVSGNPHVTSGLTAASIAWAFTAGYAANWHPVTWMSHMLDVSLFGVSAPAAHVVNLALHVANTLLLFALLRRLTRAFWPSAVVAALFAVHPLHVESVAWIAERKDVLSTFWWLVTMWLYARFVEERTAGRYALVAGSFAVALMSKPMVVTLPFVLLLLDYWPLGRLLSGGSGASAAERRPPTASGAASRKSASGAKFVSGPKPQAPSLKPVTVLLEKGPLAVLAALSSAITFLVQRSAGAMHDYGAVPFALRAENAIVSYGRYARDMVWPRGLGVFYSFPRAVPASSVVISFVVLIAITAIASALWRRAPYVIVGWLWYVGTLVPVIGLVQVGGQARADRYTYVPLVGLFIAIVWGAAALLARLREPARAPVAATLAVAALVPFAIVTHVQVTYWRDPLTLWQRAADVTTDNYHAQASLGLLQLQRGDYVHAQAHLETAVALEPRLTEAHRYLGLLFAGAGRPVDAAKEFGEVVALTPADADAHTDLGEAYARSGRADAAVQEYTEALRLNPSSALTHANLGALYGQAGRLDDAVAQLSEATRLDPDNEQAHFNLALAFAKLGRYPDATREFAETLRINPQNAAARQAYTDLTSRGGGS